MRDGSFERASEYPQAPLRGSNAAKKRLVAEIAGVVLMLAAIPAACALIALAMRLGPSVWGGMMFGWAFVAGIACFALGGSLLGD